MEAVSLSIGRVAASRRAWLGSVILALVIGLALGFLLFQRERDTAEQPRPSTSRDAGPTSEINGVPVGYARTEEGAVLAATNFGLVSTSDLIRDRQAYVRAITTFAAESWRQQAERQALNGHEYALEQYGGDIEMSSAVLRFDVLDFSPDEAKVRLWTVSVATGSKKRAAEAVWGSSTLDLAWVDGDWRVTGTENETGPVPVPLQRGANGKAVTKLMEEWREFTKGPRP